MRNIYQKLTDNRETIPFQSSEDAWFWYCLCEQLGFDRAKGGESKTARPCESSDILIAVKRLMRDGLLKPEHIRILQKYGFEQAPPHVNFGATERICRLWREAMGFLDSLLRRKGIVGCFFLI
jgi:hypothetical protein